MPLGTTTDHKIPLEELLMTLETSGYELSIEQVLEIQSLLLSSSVPGLKLKDLKFLITPIVAKNDEDQKNLYRIIDTYISEKAGEEEEERSFQRMLFKFKTLIFKAKVLWFLGTTVLAFIFYFSNNDKSIKIVRDRVEERKNTVVPKIINPSPADDQEERIVPGDKKQLTLEITGAKSPIIPEPYSYDLQMALVLGIPLGIILAFFFFFEKRRRMEIQKKSRLHNADLVTGERERQPPAIVQQDIPEQFEQIILHFPEKDYLVQKSREFFSIRANLKKPAVTDEERFDVKRSIYQTSRSAGFTSIVFSSRPKERKYLFLLEDSYPDAHITQMLKYLVSTMCATKIPVARYSYANDIRIVRDLNGNAMRLHELAHNYHDHHLIIAGDCRSLINEDTALKKDQLIALQKWASRSVITPVPVQDWSYAEKQLQEHKFHVVPAEIEAVELLTQAIAEHTIINKGALENKIRDLYSISNIDFESMDELRAYLGNEKLFQVICSLAIYPKLRWPVTLSLFSAIIKNDPKSDRIVKLDYDTLLKISRIPWLYKDELAQSVRLSLLNHLDTRTELIARETILKLLQDIKPDTPQHSLAYRELQLQYSLNSFFLFAHDQYKYRKYAESKTEIGLHWNDLNEWALKERTERGQSGLMPVDGAGKHLTVEEFLLQEKQFEKLNLNFYKVALVVLPSVLLYISFSLLRPDFAYPADTYKAVSFNALIKSNDCMPQPDTAFILVNGKTDTLRLHGNADTVRIEKIKYEGIVTLVISSKNKKTRELLVPATDSVVVISPRCR